MKTINKENIGSIIKVLRTAAGIRQKELAEKIGIKANSLSLIEAGKRDPSLSVLRSIAKILGVPVSYLFWEVQGIPERHFPKEKELLEKISQYLLELERLRLTESHNKDIVKKKI